MIGGPNDLLIEEQIVRAQPSGVERREPMTQGMDRNGDRQAPRLSVENASVAPPLILVWAAEAMGKSADVVIPVM